LNFPFDAVASSSQVGASFLQCPHQGAKNSTSQVPEYTFSKVSIVNVMTSLEAGGVSSPLQKPTIKNTKITNSFIIERTK